MLLQAITTHQRVLMATSCTSEEKLSQLLSHASNDSYEETSARLCKARNVFQDCIAQQLEKQLNTKLRTMPHSSYEEKKELAIWVNRELREFSLALRCPKTGTPTTLQVDLGSSPATGRFRLRSVTDENRHPFSSVDLFDFSLMSRFPDVASVKKWNHPAGDRVEDPPPPHR